jgi:hypothetical protein
MDIADPPRRLGPFRGGSIRIPLLSNKNGFPKLVLGALGASIVIVVGLWFGFAINYTTTRDVYFAFCHGTRIGLSSRS